MVASGPDHGMQSGAVGQPDAVPAALSPPSSVPLARARRLASPGRQDEVGTGSRSGEVAALPEFAPQAATALSSATEASFRIPDAGMHHRAL